MSSVFDPNKNYDKSPPTNQSNELHQKVEELQRALEGLSQILDTKEKSKPLLPEETIKEIIDFSMSSDEPEDVDCQDEATIYDDIFGFSFIS